MSSNIVKLWLFEINIIVRKRSSLKEFLDERGIIGLTMLVVPMCTVAGMEFSNIRLEYTRWVARPDPAQITSAIEEFRYGS